MNKSKIVLLMLFLSFSLSNADIYKPVSLLVKRAELMQKVGTCKKKVSSPLYDAGQELRVLQNAKQLANANNLETSSFLVFVQLQMDLSKQIENYYWANVTNKQLGSIDSNCLSIYRDKVKKVDEKLYPAISKNINAIKDDKHLYSRLSKLIKKQKIQGVPQDPDYIKLLTKSLQNIKITTKS